jgi:hypothetical protein
MPYICASRQPLLTKAALCFLQVYAVNMTQALCASISSCDERRWEMHPPLRPETRYYFPDYTQYSQELSPEEEALLLQDPPAPVCVDVPANASWDACRWALPGVGIYGIVACLSLTDDPQSACSVLFSGRLQQEWDSAPLSGPLEATWTWKLPAESDGFNAGGQADITIDSPVGNASALLVRCRCACNCDAG